MGDWDTQNTGFSIGTTADPAFASIDPVTLSPQVKYGRFIWCLADDRGCYQIDWQIAKDWRSVRHSEFQCQIRDFRLIRRDEDLEMGWLALSIWQTAENDIRLIRSEVGIISDGSVENWECHCALLKWNWHCCQDSKKYVRIMFGCINLGNYLEASFIFGVQLQQSRLSRSTENNDRLRDFESVKDYTGILHISLAVLPGTCQNIRVIPSVIHDHCSRVVWNDPDPTVLCLSNDMGNAELIFSAVWMSFTVRTACIKFPPDCTHW